MPSINDRYIEHDQFLEDRTPPSQCPICKGTGETRFDFINKDEKIINGYRALRGINATYKQCECMEPDPDAQTRHYVKPVQITCDDEPADAQRGECKGCKSDDVLIDSNGYCFNC